jgi:hypothetical protein
LCPTVNDNSRTINRGNKYCSTVVITSNKKQSTMLTDGLFLINKLHNTEMTLVNTIGASTGVTMNSSSKRRLKKIVQRYSQCPSLPKAQINTSITVDLSNRSFQATTEDLRTCGHTLNKNQFLADQAARCNRKTTTHRSRNRL